MNADQIIARVAVVFAVEPAQLSAGNRSAHLVHARQAAAFALKFLCDQSYVSIAQTLGYKDHSTALWAVQAAGERAKRLPAYSAKLAAIREMSS